ncbi:hypothetical protein, partial [Pseudomonas aeruginosa]|uniref:hypothetical protein n=1 Tax=Pseudomonas aeruginosa TaxID=287 RepID=UPI0031B6C04C
MGASFRPGPQDPAFVIMVSNQLSSTIEILHPPARVAVVHVPAHLQGVGEYHVQVGTAVRPLDSPTLAVDLYHHANPRKLDTAVNSHGLDELIRLTSLSHWNSPPFRYSRRRRRPTIHHSVAPAAHLLVTDVTVATAIAEKYLVLRIDRAPTDLAIPQPEILNDLQISHRARQAATLGARAVTKHRHQQNAGEVLVTRVAAEGLPDEQGAFATTIAGRMLTRPQPMHRIPR